MSKTLFSFTLCILSSLVVIGCSNDTNELDTDPLKGQENKFLNTEKSASEPEVVFYDLVNPNTPTEREASASMAASEAVSEDLMKPDPLPPEIIESIKRNQEIEAKKAEALKSIEQAKRIEAEILNENRSSDDGYTYNNSSQ